MLNIMNADMFRIRKGKSMIGVFIGLLAIVLLMSTLFKVLSSEEIMLQLENSDGPITVERVEGDFVDEGSDPIQEIQEIMPQNGTEFWIGIYGDIVNILPLIMLPFIIVIFGADYSSGAFRNLLSYYSERDKIYLSKLSLSFLVGLGAKVVFILLNLIIGTLYFGIGGISGASLIQALTGTLLMVPTLLATIAMGHCIVALTKKVSSTIAIFLVGVLGWSTVIQMAAMMFPSKPWVISLDIVSMMGSMMKYSELATSSIVMQMILSFAILIGTTVVGMYTYRKTDFDFS